MADLSNDTDMAVEQSTDNKSDGDLSSGDAHQRSPHANVAATKTEIQTPEGEIPAETASQSGHNQVPDDVTQMDPAIPHTAADIKPEEETVLETNDELLLEETQPEDGTIEPSDTIEEITELEIEPDAPPVSLNDRYNIFPSKPLPAFDAPSAKAFEANDSKGAYANLFALICIPGMAVRVDVIEQIIRQRIPGILTLMDYGIIDWPILGKKTPALVYERPTGGRVSTVMSEEPSTYNNIEHMMVSVDGIIEGLEQLSNRGITHRSLRHNNLFFSDETRKNVVLGDLVSASSGFDQPVVYETIEKGMADEGGRGNGLLEDDMYAFGVTIAFMSQNQVPIDNHSKEEIIVSKIENSTFQTIVGKEVITPKVLDIMRGLLIDNPENRWSFEEVLKWQNGLPNKPSGTTISHEAHRPIEFGGFNHSYPRTLAYSMALRPEESINLIRGGTIERWIKKDFMDGTLTPSFTSDLEEAKSQSERTKEADAVLLSHVVMILDPQAPIRYKSISYMPDAFGTALVAENIRGGDFKHLIESVTNQVPNIWNQINEDRPNLSHMWSEGTNYGRLRSHLQKAGYGYGIERCLYELNWDIPCQSPLFEREYILNIEDILPALNKIEQSIDPKTNPVDRHIAAFVAARVTKISIEPFLQEIGDPDEALQTLGALKLLASLQKQYGPDILTGLSKWIGGQMGPIIKLYQSRSTQKHLETEVPKVVRNGNLSELLELLDNPETRLTDASEYEIAIEAFRVAQDEIKKVEHDMGPNSDIALLASRKVASVTSVVIMTFVIVVMFIAG